MVTVYHRTTRKAADAILRDGFRDATGTYLTDTEHTGVWVSDRPLDANEGANGSHVLKVTVDLSNEQMADYEWVDEGKPYREWLVPAAILNAKGTVEIEDVDEAPDSA
jgi:hypothetical protein